MTINLCPHLYPQQITTTTDRVIILMFIKKSLRFVRQFSTLIIAEHNNKVLAKGVSKLLTASGKLKDEVMS